MQQPNAAETVESVGTAIIKVIGVGGGGSNAVSRMYREPVPEVEYIAVNTDRQALELSPVPIKLRVGDIIARGLGVGGDPAKGRACHEESLDEIRDLVEGSDMVFIAAGMGGGTGTGGSPIVAEAAQEVGALTVGVVTMPFSFEGTHRRKKAIEGISALRDATDTLIVIHNDRLLTLADEQLTMENAFRTADSVLRQGVQSIAELILVPGVINLDFADIRAVMEKAGPAWLAIGRGSGEDRSVEAARQAVNSPLGDVSIDGATGVIFNVTGGSDLTLDEVYQAAGVISDLVHPDANIILGTVTDTKMEDEVKITVIATGFPMEGEEEQGDAAARVVEAMRDEEMMAVPPFLRHHPSARRRLRSSRRRSDAASTSGRRA